MKLDSKTFYKILLATVLCNYAAQIPYYLHQYYLPHKFLPSLFGTVLLSLTLVWFCVAYRGLRHGRTYGYYVMLAFLSVEFLFYLQTQLSQYLIAHRILLYVYHPQGLLLFIVFGIGYINFLAAAYFLVYIMRHKQQLISH
ncbi:MAG TPA: hypothetical protein VFN56_03500 [Candidatus Saccharimonadales bacterium]|nr:hypothetical protein [Candidatus Saccharimonadales bacterium]